MTGGLGGRDAPIFAARRAHAARARWPLPPAPQAALGGAPIGGACGRSAGGPGTPKRAGAGALGHAPNTANDRPVAAWGATRSLSEPPQAAPSAPAPAAAPRAPAQPTPRRPPTPPAQCGWTRHGGRAASVGAISGGGREDAGAARLGAPAAARRAPSPRGRWAPAAPLAAQEGRRGAARPPAPRAAGDGAPPARPLVVRPSAAAVCPSASVEGSVGAAEAPAQSSRPPRHGPAGRCAGGLPRAASAPALASAGAFAGAFAGALGGALGGAPPAELAGFPADVWTFAAAPRRVESLRWQLAAVYEEVSAARREVEEAAASCGEWAARTEANKRYMRRLREEEAAALDAGAPASPADGARAAPGGGAWQPDRRAVAQQAEELDALRAETTILADSVAEAAARQTSGAWVVKELRAAARLARVRRAARAAAGRCRRLGGEAAEGAAGLEEAREASASLRDKARSLRDEAAAEEREAHAAGAAAAERAAAADAAAAAGRAETAAASRRARQARHEELLEAEVQAKLHNHVEELSAQLLASQAMARRLGTAIHGAEGAQAAATAELWEADGQAAPGAGRAAAGGLGLAAALAELRGRAGAAAAARAQLEAELLQQRDATLAWKASAKDLASGHREVSMVASQATRAGWEALLDDPLGATGGEARVDAFSPFDMGYR